jgi:hypothetical protein
MEFVCHVINAGNGFAGSGSISSAGISFHWRWITRQFVRNSKGLYTMDSRTFMRESFAAGPVRVLSRDEIERLAAEGCITPVDLIPLYQIESRQIWPVGWFKGSYSSYGSR